MSASFNSGFKSRIINWIVDPDGLSDPDTLLRERVNAAKPSLGFFILPITSSVNTTIGLTKNSNTVVIGAMIITPLTEAIISLGLAIANLNIQLAIEATSLIILVSAVVATISSLAYKSLNIDYVDKEILSRAFPYLRDLLITVATGADDVCEWQT